MHGEPNGQIMEKDLYPMLLAEPSVELSEITDDD
jgi:hypothetical protein